MGVCEKVGDFLLGLVELLLLVPPPRQADRIPKNARPKLCPGDRIAWHRPWVLIHEAIVLEFDEETCEAWVLERTKEGCTSSSVIVRKVRLHSEKGDLYKYDRQVKNDGDTLKGILKYYGRSGYNIFGLNCQHLSSSVQKGEASSYQNQWITCRVLLDILVKCVVLAIAESVESKREKEPSKEYKINGEMVGGVVAIGFYIGIFLIESFTCVMLVCCEHVPCCHSARIIGQQFSMTVGNCGGAVLSAFLTTVIKHDKGCSFKTGPIVTSFLMGIIVAVAVAIAVHAMLACLSMTEDECCYWSVVVISMCVALIAFFFLAVCDSYSFEVMLGLVLGTFFSFLFHLIYHLLCQCCQGEYQHSNSPSIHYSKKPAHWVGVFHNLDDQTREQYKRKMIEFTQKLYGNELKTISAKGNPSGPSNSPENTSGYFNVCYDEEQA